MARRRDINVLASPWWLSYLAPISYYYYFYDTNLRINHERPATRVAHHDGVVDGEGVVGQAVDDPCADHHGVAQHGVEGEVARGGDADLAGKTE